MRGWTAAAIIVGMTAVMAVVLRAAYRRPLGLHPLDVLDVYTTEHVLWGMLCQVALSFTPWSLPARAVATAVTAVAFELGENNPAMIRLFHAKSPVNRGYNGDSVANSTSDVVASMAGFGIAHHLPWHLSLLAVVAVEIANMQFVVDNALRSFLDVVS